MPQYLSDIRNCKYVSRNSSKILYMYVYTYTYVHFVYVFMYVQESWNCLIHIGLASLVVSNQTYEATVWSLNNNKLHRYGFFKHTKTFSCLPAFELNSSFLLCECSKEYFLRVVSSYLHHTKLNFAGAFFCFNVFLLILVVIVCVLISK